MSPQIVPASDRDALAGLYRSGWEAPPDVVDGVRAILTGVRARGDDALVAYTRQLDAPQFEPGMLRVPVPSLAEASKLVPAAVAQALELARERVGRFHERQRRSDIDYVEEDGARYGFHARPLQSVAAYVPGGTAVLPSSVIMTTVPARTAGVTRIAVFSPPQRDGKVSAAIAFACALCGVDELYAVGGAQAIGAAAYGTASIARVDKIVGPGNAWVTEAKRQVYGICGIDGLAGPSEVLVIADAHADPRYVVAEVRAQGEHAGAARIAVVSVSRELLEACARLLEAAAPGVYLIQAATPEEILEVAERMAPEHVSLQVRDVERYAARLAHAGAIFIGAHTPVAAGDYLAGTNHVLPTAGAARFASGLRLDDFMRTFSVFESSDARMRQDAELIAQLAEFEGLPLHAAAARLRLES